MSVDDRFYKNILDNIYDGICLINRDKKITFWNKGAKRITGYDSSEVVGKYCSDNILAHVDDKGNNLCKSEFCPAGKTLSEGHEREEIIYLKHKKGYRIKVLERITPIRDSNNQIVGASEIFSDNSMTIASQEKINELQKLALLDPLTKVGNRRYGEIMLQARLDEFQRYSWPFGIVFADIDHFKKINDKYGHDIGDRVLKTVAQTLSNSLRSFDIVSRWGGEEFVAIITGVNEEQLFTVANKIRVLVEYSIFHIDLNQIRVTVSIGATLAKINDTVDTLMKRADQLMYQSKTSGRNRVSINLNM